jgi:small subunit ribosomal protein S17
MSEKNANTIRTLTGRVVSAKADKSITVVVERLVKHPMYGKFIRRSTRLMAHDEENQCREGDMVAISECRPLSKRKSWRLHEIVERAAD